MNILIINAFYYPNIIGGTENSIKILAENLVQLGNNVTIYTLDGEKILDLNNPEIINKVKIYRGYSKEAYNTWKYNKRSIKSIITNRWHFLYNLKSNRDIFSIIKKEHIEIIHTNNLMSISYGSWKIAKKMYIPVVHTLRDYWMMDPSTIIDESNTIIRKIHSIFFKNISNKYIPFVTAPSQRVLEIFTSKNYFKYSSQKCIYNAVNLNRDILLQCQKEKINRTATNIKFLYVGKLGEHKGIHILLSAFTSYKNSNISLHICGNGPMESHVKKIAEKDKRIIYCGKLKTPELEQVYKDADVLIVPSIWEEPFGRIVIEGAQYALPTIGSDRGGIPEIIKMLDYGKIYSSNSKKELLNSIKLYANRNIIKADIQKIDKNLHLFSSDYQLKQFEQLYKFLISTTNTL